MRERERESDSCVSHDEYQLYFLNNIKVFVSDNCKQYVFNFLPLRKWKDCEKIIEPDLVINFSRFTLVQITMKVDFARIFEILREISIKS